jgi:hypothetical protein
VKWRHHLWRVIRRRNLLWYCEDIGFSVCSKVAVNWDNYLGAFLLQIDDWDCHLILLPIVSISPTVGDWLRKR